MSELKMNVEVNEHKTCWLISELRCRERPQQGTAWLPFIQEMQTHFRVW